jgi:hypothetical protein
LFLLGSSVSFEGFCKGVEGLQGLMSSPFMVATSPRMFKASKHFSFDRRIL